MKTKPNIPNYLLWEYDLGTFNYTKSYKIVIERILLLGKIEDWIEKNTPVEPINYIDSKWPAWNDGNFNMVYHLDEKYHFNYFLQPIATCFRNNNSILLGKTEFAFQC